MTAPAGSTAAALRRADREWCRTTADEPLDNDRLAVLTAAAQALVNDTATEAIVQHHLPPRAPAETAELDQLRAALATAGQRREDLRIELWKHIEVQQRRADRAEHERDQLRGALEVARRERDNYAEQLQQRAKDNVELLRQAETWESEYERVRDEKLVELADDAEDRKHRHAWEWQPALKRMPLPCSCGDPWPLQQPPDVATVVPHRKPKGSRP